ncbi:MAG: hypothetical protein HKN73_02205, partial [Gemmatimonadetes bacterium]|nr:hypothetical protein [Gemmatimonadota bacterium]
MKKNSLLAASCFMAALIVGPAPVEGQSEALSFEGRLGTRGGAASPWARGGILFYETEVGEVHSNRSLGFEGAVEIDFEVTDRFSV